MKRYAIEYGKFREYEVLSETDKTFTSPGGKYANSGKPRKVAKAGTFTTPRLAIEAFRDDLRRAVERLTSHLDLKAQALKTYNEVLTHPDSELIEALQKK